MNRQWLFVLGFLLLSIALVGFNSLAAVQDSFVLDLDSPLFRYSESAFNDSSTVKQNIYNGSENVTYWIKIPKNSVIVNATFNVTGEIIYIYQRLVTSDGILGVSIGNVTTHPGNEIVAGTNNLEPTVRVLYGNNGSLIWSKDVSTSPNNVLSTAIGNVTSNPGNEIAVGEQDTYVYVLRTNRTGGSVVWNYPTGGEVKSVAIGDINGGSNEVAAGSADGKVYILDYQGNQLWNFTVDSGTVYSVAIGNLTSDSGNEIAAAADKIYILNSSGALKYKKSLGTTIFSLAIGDVNQNEGNELAAGALDNKVYLLNVTDTQANVTWSYTTGGDVKSVIIEDVTSNPGNEVVAGSDDGKIYTLSTQGSLVWSYATASLVEAVAAGNLTADPGNEVAAGAINGYLYVFNFDYFPTNTGIDVGAAGGYDWTYPGKLRTTTKAYGLNSAIQSFLSSCTADAGGFCNVSFVFHSDYQGRLRVSAVNITYSYNTSSVITYQNVSAWSRTNNIQVNESVGSYVRNISFVINPANNVVINYIKVNSTATSCNFNGTAYATTTVSGKKVCDVPDFTVPKSGSLPHYAFLWDNNMSTGIPVYQKEGIPYNTTGPDNYYWRKNFTVYNVTGFPDLTLTNVTGNVSLNDSVVKGYEYLRVWWSGQWCDITPSTASSTCNTTSPVYRPKMCGSDRFWTCKQDTDSDGVYDYFDFRQPRFVANTTYQAGGLRNLNANLSSPAVAPGSDVWGSYFNYTVYVSDPESNMVNVTLWVRINSTGAWQSRGTKNVTSSKTIWFYVQSATSWLGMNSYRFEFQDFNGSGDPIHSKQNTSISAGPDVKKHSVSIAHVQGNGSSVYRGQSTPLVVRVYDDNLSAWVGSGVSCRFWITTNGSKFDSGHSGVTNASGHCTYAFAPNSTYMTGNQTWKAGTYGNSYYLNANSTGFVVSVKGRVNISMILPKENQRLLRNSTNYFLGMLYDEYGNPASISGYNCSFWFNGTYLNSSDTNATGYCNYSWSPGCGVSQGNYFVNVTLSGTSYFYSIWDNESHAMINMTDQLNTAVTSPAGLSSYHKGDSVSLNSTTNDTCGLASPGDFNVSWSKKWKRSLKIYFNESGGINRTREPFIINGTQLEDMGIDLSDWRINYTVVASGGSTVAGEVKAWTNASKTETNDSQVYMNNYSELVFLVDLKEYQSRAYWIYYNESNPADYNTSYILNGGFENNDTRNWQYFESSNCMVAGIDRCKGYTKEVGTETTGNYSMYLYSECTTIGCNNVSIRQSFSTPINSNYLKIRYRAWGEFSTASGAYLRLKAGNGYCSLNVTPATSYPASQWKDYLCSNTSFQTAKNVSVEIHDVLDSGGGMGASHVYIDYLCIANASGDCVTFDSGAPLPRDIISQTYIDSGENITWSIPFTEQLGKRRVIANSSGNFYQPGQDWSDILIYGWSEVLYGNISSDHCMYNQTFVCMRNATLTMFCKITDANSSLGIGDYNVSFYGDDAHLGYNLTNQSGFALWTWANSTDVLGTHNITCNITDLPALYYNTTPDDNATVYFNITSGNTTASLFQTPYQRNATNMTRAYNYTFSLNLFVNNTGNGTMYGVDLSIATPTGIHASGVYCGVIPKNSYCNVSSQVDVTYLAVPGNRTINVTLSWYNADSTDGNVKNQTSVIVINKTALNIVEKWINYTIARGDSKNVGNFTVESFGNTEILGIVFSEYGQNASYISQWIGYTPANIPSIARGADQLVQVNISTPFNATTGFYVANIRANATGSSCSPAGECWDYLLLNLTVAVADWERTPDNLSKTVGLISDNGSIGSITVTNNKNANYGFSVTLTGNGTPYITASPLSFGLAPFGNRKINVYHNTSVTYPPGYWFVNLSISNLNGSFPLQLNASIFLNVINMSVQIVSPNQTNPTSPINASDTVNITANATLSGVPISSSMVWTVQIAGQSCTNVQYRYNSTEEYWEINCTAPLVPGNPLNNTLTVTGNYTTMSGTVVSDSEPGAVVYEDITPPQFAAVQATPANYYHNKPWILFSVVITDNGVVDSAWANVTYQSTTVTISNYTVNGNNYTFNFSNPNIVTDYDITVFANDTMGLTNSTTGWFDVYKPLQLIGNSLDPNGRNQTINFTFYRAGTNYVIHSFRTNSSHGKYNHTIHKRVYDLLVVFGNQRFRFSSLNATLSAQYQHGVPNPSNLTNPMRFDLFPNRTSEDITNIDLPNTAENILMAAVVESPYLNYSTKTITFDYTSALVGGSYQEGDLRILYCSNWDFSGRSCPAEFAHFNEVLTPNVTTNTFTFTTNSSTTAYAIAETCYPNTCGYTPPITPGGPGTTGPSGPVIPPTRVPVCGNGVCETGENDLNCPADCLEYAFDVKTDAGNEVYIKLHPGENKTYPFTIMNRLQKSIIAFLSLQGLRDYIRLEREIVGINARGNATVNLHVSVPENINPGIYKTTLSVTSEGETRDVPVTLEVSLTGRNLLSLNVDLISPVVVVGGEVRFKVELKNLGYKRQFGINMTYMIKDTGGERTLKKEIEYVEIEDVLTYTRTLSLSGLEMEPGQYFIEVWGNFDEYSVKDVDGFDVVEFSLLDMFLSVVPWLILILVLVTFGYFGRMRYIKWKLSRVRYPLPVNFNKIPRKTDDAFWLGRVADTNRDAWYDPKDLMTHVLIAGSTGAGKSVGASIIAEEALEKKIPIVVFDPTAQWTGFVKSCTDENVLSYYPRFGMDRKQTRPYKGMIFDVEDPHIDIDFKKYMNPGEITVFTMNRLQAGEYDVAIKCIVDSMFRIEWEESTELRMIVIFDEVHRLLEKYGGIGGYTSLERACREFRKWGIGVIMCSQVLADFKEAIAGNVLTDVQLNTKSLTDIGKVKEKYGPVYAQRVSRQGIGVGMIQHPRYNEGKPWFINFRPPYHNPHKISAEEMAMYKEFAAKLDEIDMKLEAMKREGKDMFEIELEVKLAKDKLKQGRFRMAKIYIESLEKYFR